MFNTDLRSSADPTIEAPNNLFLNMTEVRKFGCETQLKESGSSVTKALNCFHNVFQSNCFSAQLIVATYQASQSALISYAPLTYCTSYYTGYFIANVVNKFLENHRIGDQTYFDNLQDYSAIGLKSLSLNKDLQRRENKLFADAINAEDIPKVRKLLTKKLLDGTINLHRENQHGEGVYHNLTLPLFLKPLFENEQVLTGVTDLMHKNGQLEYFLSFFGPGRSDDRLKDLKKIIPLIFFHLLLKNEQTVSAYIDLIRNIFVEFGGWGLHNSVKEAGDAFYGVDPQYIAEFALKLRNENDHLLLGKSHIEISHINVLYEFQLQLIETYLKNFIQDTTLDNEIICSLSKGEYLDYCAKLKQLSQHCFVFQRKITLKTEVPLRYPHNQVESQQREVKLLELFEEVEIILQASPIKSARK